MINNFSIPDGAKYFSSVFQNYLVFIPAKKYIKYYSGTTQIDSWKSNRVSEENIENTSKLDSNYAPTFINHDLFNEHCLINSISISKKVINIHISNSLNLLTDFMLNNCLLRSLKLTNTRWNVSQNRFFSFPYFSFSD